MVNTINAGVIGCDMTEDFFMTSGNSKAEKFYWKKAYNTNSTINLIPNRYPDTEIVSDVDDIVNDEEISLVIVSKDHLVLAKPIIDSGKSIRII